MRRTPGARDAEIEKSTMSTKRTLTTAFAGLALAGLICGGAVAPAFAHGYIWDTDPAGVDARAAISGNNVGSVQYEPQSLEALKGFPAGGPADGKIASAGGQFGGVLDEQTSTRWIKNEVRPGPLTIKWKYTAPHNTSKWSYYVTKQGWNQNAPLNRASLELVTTVQHDGSAASTNPNHVVNIPSDRSGYHVLLAVWDVSNTVNAFYNVVDLNVSGNPQAPDTTAPSVPGTVAAGAVTSSSVALSWKASTDNVSVSGYDVYRDGAKVGTTTNLSYTDTGLKASTAYKYTVVARDSAGNSSAASTAVTATTTAANTTDTEAPGKPGGVHSMTTTATSADIMWTAATDNVGVVKYSVQRSVGGAAFAEVGTTTTALNLVNSGLTPSTSYSYKVVAFDAAGNSTSSNVVTVVTKADGGTSTYPTWIPAGSYVKGDRVSYNGKNYEAVQSFTGSGDPAWITAVSLWRQI